MTAEELMNSEKYEPDNGISFEDYHGDMADIVPSMMIEFAQYHVEQALKEASKSAEIYEIPENPYNPSFGIKDRVVDKDTILNAYPKENIK
tara:strand:- start:87 stop:359 length:273 start_codon:yes stop_codon:yes gene_type:complete